jgi:hypothetical protein
MTHMSLSICTDASNEKIVPLNQDIGYLLMKYLGGLDVINFMEAVNGSEQFGTIAITEEHIFFQMFMKFLKKETIKVNVPYLNFYLDVGFIDDLGYLCPNQYHQGEPPLLRLFIHPTFTVEAFEKLCCMYSRLLPFNTHTYIGNLVLFDYFKFKHLLGCTRELNSHEQSLFKGLIL